MFFLIFYEKTSQTQQLLTSLSFYPCLCSWFLCGHCVFHIKPKLLEARRNYAVPSFTSDFMHAS